MRKHLRFALSVLISTAILLFLFRFAKPVQVMQTIAETDFRYLLLGYLFYILGLMARTLRFRVLLKNSLGSRELFPIVMIYNFMMNLIPMKLGELSYVFLLKKMRKGYRQGLSTLIMSRALDFAVILSTLLVAVLVQKSLFRNLVPLLSVSLVFIVCSTLLIVLFPEFFAGLFSRICKAMKPGKGLASLTERITGFILHFREFRSPEILILSFALSVLISILSFLSTYFIVLSIGFPVPFWTLVIVISSTFLSSIIPVNGIAGLGTIEGIWVAVLSNFGYGVETSVVLSLGTHLLQLFLISMLGLAGFFGARKTLSAAS